MPADLSRRSFIATATAASALLASDARALTAAPLRNARQRTPWIPSDAFLDRLPEIMRLARVPAVSIATVHDGEIAFERTLGVRNAESGEPADNRTVFEAASLSKPTVAYVAMRLREEGLLDIDAPLVEYVRPEHLLDDPRAERITARHVMSHSSGLRNWRRPTDSDFPLSFDPGTDYQYSGEGFVWLARALENVSRTGFVRLMHDRLFRPLGLEATTFLWNPALADRMATGHDSAGEPTRNGLHVPMARTHHERAETLGRPVDEWMWDDLVAAAREARPDRPPMPGGIVPNAAASLLSTAGEYARFVTRLLDSPTGPALLPDAARSLMSTTHTDIEAPIGWGLGVALEHRPDGPCAWHWGNNGDFHSYFMGDVSGRRAIVVFTNANGGPKVYQRVVRDAVGFDPASLIWI